VLLAAYGDTGGGWRFNFKPLMIGLTNMAGTKAPWSDFVRRSGARTPATRWVRLQQPRNGVASGLDPYAFLIKN
jgi:hypothetical protein